MRPSTPASPLPPTRCFKAPRQAPPQGFTLVELVFVVVIVGILAAVLAPRYYNVMEQTRSSVARSVASEGVSRFTGAFNKYQLDTHAKPATLADLSNATYLNLDGAGRTNIGDYDLLYTLGGATLTVQCFEKNGATSLSSISVAWP